MEKGLKRESSEKKMGKNENEFCEQKAKKTLKNECLSFPPPFLSDGECDTTNRIIWIWGGMMFYLGLLLVFIFLSRSILLFFSKNVKERGGDDFHPICFSIFSFPPPSLPLFSAGSLAFNSSMGNWAPKPFYRANYVDFVSHPESELPRMDPHRRHHHCEGEKEKEREREKEKKRKENQIRKQMKIDN